MAGGQLRKKKQAECFNSHFARQTMLGVPDDETPNSCSLQFNTLSFSYLSTTPSDVYGILSKLKSGKAPGIDHITPDLLRYCANGIACSLACLFNRSFELSQWELCNYVIITIAALLKIENWASGVMFDRPSSMLTGKDVVSHSLPVVLTNILFFLLF